MNASILWRRLDLPGHDACRLVRQVRGWRIEGTAVFLHEGVPAQLRYGVDCDDAWRTQQAEVHGWLGSEGIEHRIARTPEGIWTLDGAAVQALEDCIDFDLGFTPATNLIQLRRMSLQIGQGAEAPVAWLDLKANTLVRLSQRYERRSESLYGYDAPSVPYAAQLEVDSSGFIRVYPGLWEAER